MLTRRDLMKASGAALAGAATLSAQRKVEAAVPGPGATRYWDKQSRYIHHPPKAFPPGLPGRDYKPVVTPNNVALPFKIVDGVKVFHLVAEPVWHEFAPGLHAHCWGYNGHVHGPTIEAVEGERVRIYVTNKLKEPTTVHWHGLFVPNGMDGVGGLTQRSIRPGETYKYEFTLIQHGSFLYHPHYDSMTQEGMGLMGMFIIHPRYPRRPAPDRDFALLLSEWAIGVGTSRPNVHKMGDFNVLTINAHVFPATDPLVVKTGDRVRIRIGNLSAMDHHPIHLHGHSFNHVASDGGEFPESAHTPMTTVLALVGSVQVVEFVSHSPGDWAMHCHMTHHIMNQMGHDAPNMIGVDKRGLDEKVRKLVPHYMTMGTTGAGKMGEMAEKMPTPPNSIPMEGKHGPHGYITLGGMFTILKVRDHLTSYEDPGWYKHPPGTSAGPASLAELQRDLGGKP